MTSAASRRLTQLLPASTGDAVEAAPFVKWVGGKRGLMPQLERLFPRRFERYFEPFVGGGAVFFHLNPERAILSDENAELMHAYRVVRDEPQALIDALAALSPDEDTYYRIRGTDPEALSPVERAARLLYLNRTCYNGLYRVNAKGGFNVPFGRHKNPTICNAEGLMAASRVLAGKTLARRPYMAVLEEAAPGDFVYFDPPYHPLNATSSFTQYTPGSFTARDQADLAEVFSELARRGVKVMLSNSDTPLIRELYDGFIVSEVQAPRMVNRNAAKRGPVTELVIRNYHL